MVQAVAGLLKASVEWVERRSTSPKSLVKTGARMKRKSSRNHLRNHLNLTGPVSRGRRLSNVRDGGQGALNIVGVRIFWRPSEDSKSQSQPSHTCSVEHKECPSVASDHV
jgi:hypothetical protein